MGHNCYTYRGWETDAGATVRIWDAAGDSIRLEGDAAAEMIAALPCTLEDLDTYTDPRGDFPDWDFGPADALAAEHFRAGRIPRLIPLGGRRSITVQRRQVTSVFGLDLPDQWAAEALVSGTADAVAGAADDDQQAAAMLALMDDALALARAVGEKLIARRPDLREQVERRIGKIVPPEPPIW